MRISDCSSDVCSSDLPLLREARRQIEAWFAGRLTRFDLPLTPAASPRGDVLRAAIVAIPHGETASYGQVARAVESGPRAVGQACARNRSEERRVGTECVRKCRSRWAPYH